MIRTGFFCKHKESAEYAYNNIKNTSLYGDSALGDIFLPTEKGQIEPDAYPRAGWFRESLGHPYVMRLSIWFVLLGISLSALRTFSYPSMTWHNQSAHALLDFCAALLEVCIVYCLWVEYCVSAERKLLLATVAFSGLALGQSVQTISSLFTTDAHSAFRIISSQFYYVWQVVAAIMLVMAARNTAMDDRQQCRRIGLRTLVGTVIVSLFLASVAFAVRQYWPYIEHAFPGNIGAHVHQMLRWLLAPKLMRAISLCTLGVAYLTFVIEHLKQDDTISDGISKCLLMLGASQIAMLMSGSEGDLAYWWAHAFGMTGLLLFLFCLGVEFGTSYADAHSRIEHLEAVHYISTRLNSSLDLRVVLLTFVSDTATMLNARFASIMLADYVGETLATVATYGLPDLPLAPRQPQPVEGKGRPGFYSGHTAKSFREKHVCVVDDVYTDVEFVPWHILSEHDGYAVSVPLIYHEMVLGVMNIFFDKNIRLNAERIRLFQTLASSASVSIANAQIYDGTLRQNDDDNYPEMFCPPLAS